SHTDVCIVGIPDDEWGQAVVAVAAVAATPGGPAEAAPPITPSPAVTPHPTSTSENRLTPISAETLAQVRAAVTARLGVPSAPRAIYLADTLPLKGIGKIDRAAIRRIIEETHGHRHRMV
ncbi:MAG: hypothetical protein LBB54_01460, partial [Cellulomonadaceae bacterium]|nr:hypothetical protein [Cellulomonadaceae bacterium]